jgi:hypothetical protein
MTSQASHRVARQDRCRPLVGARRHARHVAAALDGSNLASLASECRMHILIA